MRLYLWLRALLYGAWSFLRGNALLLVICSLGTLLLLREVLGSLADLLQVLQAGGWPLLLVVPVLTVGLALLLKQLVPGNGPRGRRRRRPPVDRRQVAAGVVLLLLGAALTAPHALRVAASSTAPPVAAPEPSPAPTAEPSPAPSPTPSGVAVPRGSCPLPDPTDPALPAVEVRVVYWCHGEVLTPGGVDPLNYQIKVRPRLVNNTTGPMSVSIGNPSAIRLLVEGPQVDQRWSPPPLTAGGGDRPLLVECDGKKFWGIPPNLPRDAVLVGDAYSGFATSWQHTTLEPGQVAFSPLRSTAGGAPVQEGNLVFQVPLEDQEAVIYGLAVVDPERGNAVRGLARFDEDWGRKLHPAAF
ncbi:hypothetical protein ACFV4N_21005 [Actinosynnema sp. NPDC059797]